MTVKGLSLVVAMTALVSGFGTFVVREKMNDDEVVVGAERASIRSAALGEEREYFVHLPEGYAAEPSRRYPVLYVLDGASQSGHTADSASLLARVGVVPPMIVVGIPSVDGETRNRDYTPEDMRLDTEAATSPLGAADHFLAFLQTELIAQIEHDFRTARPRMLAGWSRGALFVVYAQIKAPTLFDAVFAHSPALWREDDLLVRRLEGALRAQPRPAGFLYVSLGDQENEKMTAAYQHAVRVLKEHAPSTLRWRADLSVGGVHETNPRLSTPVGLCAMFAASVDAACHALR